MRRKFYVSLLLVLLAFSLLPSQRVRGTENVANKMIGDDAVSEAYPSDNYGSYDPMSIRDKSGATVRIVIKANLTIPDNVNVINATLRLFYASYYESYSDPAGKTVCIHRNIADFSESSVTWNSAPGFEAAETDCITIPSSTQTWVEFNVTDDVIYFLNNNINYGWAIKFQTEGLSSGYSMARFNSRENASYAPQLVIYYETANQPPSVLISSISPTSTTRGNTIQISGTASDSDGSVSAVYVNITDPQGTLVVTNGLASGTTSWSYSWGSSASSTLGYYTVCAISEDDAGAKSSQVCQSNAFQLLNNAPQITGNGSEPTPPIQVNSSVLFWLNATDFENSASEMTASITITAPNGTTVISNAAMSYNSTSQRWEYQFTPDTTGTWSVTMSITDADSDSDSTSWSFDVTSGPSIDSLSVSPSSTERPATVEINATISDPDTAPSSITASYKVYYPSGALHSSGSLTLSASSGNTGYFAANITIATSDEVGQYDIEISASDGSVTTTKLFANVLTVSNAAPTVSSVTVNATSVERGKTVLISVSASDPDTPAGGLTVNVKIDDPSGVNVLSTTATWNSASSRYEATWTPAANSPLGQYSIEATATDPEGETGGPATASFNVTNALPQIISLNVSNSTVYVNSSVLIQVNASDFETPEVDLQVKLNIDSTVGNATYNSTSGLFEYSFVPTDPKSYDITVNVTDADGGTATKTFSSVITAVLPNQQNQTMTTTTQIQDMNVNLTGGFDLKSWLSQLFSGVPVLSELQQVLGTANTLISLSIGLFTLYAIIKSSKDKRKRRR